jgi:exodeoxyribonuclease-3
MFAVPWWPLTKRHWPTALQDNTYTETRQGICQAVDALKSTLMEANVDTWVRGRPHASDHAPAWIQLRDAGIARLVKTIGRRAATKGEGRARSAKAKTRRGIRKK